VNDLVEDQSMSGYDIEGSRSQYSIMQASFEMDPNKMSTGDDAELNSLQFQLIAQKILKAITDNKDLVPPQFRIMLAHIKHLITERYPDDQKLIYVATSAFFFLRFICPSLIAPHIYGLLPEPPNSKTQRMLVLLSKIFQNIANDSVPKEEFMTRMRDFVDHNQENIAAFYNAITVVDSGVSKTFSPTPIPESVKLNSLATLHNQLVLNKEKIIKKADEYGDHMKKVVQEALPQILLKLGPPPQQERI